MDISREKKAVSAYFKLLEKKGAKSGMLYKRSVFLDKLTPLLAGKEINRSIYSNAISSLMKDTPADIWHECLNTAREFYPFWTQDIKAIAAFNRHGGFDIQPQKWVPETTTLKSLTDRLATEKFDATDARQLKLYANALKDKGADQLLLDTRINLAKILLIQLKGAPLGDARVYRTAVDFTLPMFKADESKQLFLFVIREFYYYWIGDYHPETNIDPDGLYN